MQFKRDQREVMKEAWGSSSRFFSSLGQPAREIVEKAYSLRFCSARERAQSQEYLTLAVSLFARKIGVQKSQAVHALLTGRMDKLLEIKGRKPGAVFSINTIEEDWQASFREVGVA